MLRQLKISSIVLAAAIFLVPFPIQGQDVGQIVIGQKIKLYSRITKQDRILWIYTPDATHTSDVRYPVLYLLDGESHFIHATGIIQFLSEVGRMPKMIVAGIESTDRMRDFTPPPPDSTIPGSGGADTFLQSMRDEIIPYVESHYNTVPFRALVGHSLGGSFVLHALLTHPEIFNAYLIISPNLWWGDDTLVNELGRFLKKNSKAKAFVYETHTTMESPKNIESTERLRTLIDANHLSGLDWKIQLLPTESHESIVHKSIYDGLEYIFSPWGLPPDLTAIGMPGIQRHYKDMSVRYGYPIDPPEQIVNGLGYGLLSEGKFAEAIAVFKWNVQHYPKSANAHDSLGEAYAKSGDKKLAIESYEKSIALNPNNKAGLEILRKLKAK